MLVPEQWESTDDRGRNRPSALSDPHLHGFPGGARRPKAGCRRGREYQPRRPPPAQDGAGRLRPQGPSPQSAGPPDSSGCQRQREREGQRERRGANQRSRPERPDRKGPERERPAAGEEAEDRAGQMGRCGVELPRSAGGGPATRTSRGAAIGTRQAGPGTPRPAQSPERFTPTTSGNSPSV